MKGKQNFKDYFHTESTKQKMSKVHLGKKMSNKTKRKIGLANSIALTGKKGTPRTNRWKRKIGDANSLSINEVLTKLKKNSKTAKLKVLLFKHNIKKNKCEKCENDTKWNNMNLVLQLHHIDGDRTNNTLRNLQILCPNCHSETNNFRWKDTKKYKKYD